MKQRKVLVLLATYNGLAWLGEQLDSILSQQGVDLIVEVSDDGSTDGTAALIQERSLLDGRVVLHSHKNSSGSAGANFRRMYRGANLSDFDYVALADQDDLWDSNKLAVAVRALEESGASGYSCSVVSFWPNGRERLICQEPSTRSVDFLFEGAGQGCTFVVRRELFGRLQEFAVSHHQACEQLHYHDWLIYLFARVKKARWFFDSQPWMSYRQHGANEIGSKASVGAIVKRLKLIRDGWYRQQVAAAHKLAVLAGAEDPAFGKFTAILHKRDSFSRRCLMAGFLLRNGRRRTADRLVLAFSAVAGWI